NICLKVLDFRRKSDKKRKNRENLNREDRYRNKSKKSDESSSATSSAEESKEFEKNPGNPYTLHGNRYLQNFLWNHFMDGDHMNIDPYGPKFKNIGLPGPALFFGRKWWYFNQDDYKPMR
ncbi:uncharacterized protein LOC106141357, partial [Amyelois transitella]|uniref:uncharacterized protein LOC106141357 n=1 Tax=Amyelois transitella TaxID=680683 RepID=UPI0029902A75